MNFIAVPTVSCPVYGDRVLINPAHVISVTLMPQIDATYDTPEVPAYITIRIVGSALGSEIKTTLSSWAEWYLLTS
jgi:hypothetical protein